jgi:hypothetical protein
VHGHAAGRDLAGERLVGAEQQLLAGLPPGVERAGDLGAAEAAVVEQPAVLAGKRDPLRRALVDDVDAQLCQPVHVRFARSVVAALDRVVEQPVDAVAVVGVVLRRVDAALGGDRVRPAGAVLVAEAAHAIPELGQAGGRRRAGQTGPDDEHVEPSLVGRVDQLHLEPALVPLAGDRPVGDRGPEGR